MTFSFFDAMPPVIGHRGACGHAPENTIASFQKAIKFGVRAIEIDVMVSKDNQPVICHDTSVTRCTDGNGPVLLKTLDEIRALDAGSWFSETYKGQQIPTLAEALDFSKINNLLVNLEIKPTHGWQVPTAEKVCADLPALLSDNQQILISSFNEDCLAVASKLLPNHPIGFLTDILPPDWLRRLKAVNAASFHCHHTFATAENIKAVKSEGYKYLVYTVNDPDDAKRLLDWGVDAVITDYPDRMLPLI
jgi:glycerophosphoryl diester phosphodiesterase